MIYLLIILVIVFTDLILKDYIEAKKEKDFPYNISIKGKKDIITIDRLHNKGLILEKGKKFFDLILSLHIFVILIFIIRFIDSLRKKENVLNKLGLAFIVAGGLSNLYDRFIRKYVVDYIILNVKIIKKVVFNIGDLFIVIGVIFRFLGGIFNWISR